MSTETTVVVLSLPCGAGATVTVFLRTMYLVRKKELTSYSCVCVLSSHCYSRNVAMIVADNRARELSIHLPLASEGEGKELET